MLPRGRECDDTDADDTSGQAGEPVCPEAVVCVVVESWLSRRVSQRLDVGRSPSGSGLEAGEGAGAGVDRGVAEGYRDRLY